MSLDELHIKEFHELVAYFGDYQKVMDPLVEWALGKYGYIVRIDENAIKAHLIAIILSLSRFERLLMNVED